MVLMFTIRQYNIQTGRLIEYRVDYIGRDEEQ